MFPRRRLNSKWPLKRGRAAYIAGKEVQLGVVGARGRLDLGGEKGAGSGSGLSQDGAQCTTVDYHKTDQLLPPLYIPPVSDGVRAISWSTRIQWSAGEQAHNAQKMHRNVQKMHKICTAAAQWPEHTGVEWGGPFVPILLSSLVSQIPRLSVFTIFQLPFNCRLSDHPVCQFSITFQLWSNTMPEFQWV